MDRTTTTPVRASLSVRRKGPRAQYPQGAKRPMTPQWKLAVRHAVEINRQNNVYPGTFEELAAVVGSSKGMIGKMLYEPRPGDKGPKPLRSSALVDKVSAVLKIPLPYALGNTTQEPEAPQPERTPQAEPTKQRDELDEVIEGLSDPDDRARAAAIIRAAFGTIVRRRAPAGQ